MKRVTGLGGLFFKAKILRRCTRGTRNTWEFRASLAQGAMFQLA